MSTSSTQKQILVKGLAVAIGELVLGVNGPFLFQRIGIGVPAAATTGAAIGAVLGYLIADKYFRFQARRQPVSSVPLITRPEVSAGLDEFRTGGVGGTIEVERTREHIKAALAGLPDFDAVRIRVEVRGGKVVLRGKVHSWNAEAEAERIAFDFPGIQRVENWLEVVPNL